MRKYIQCHHKRERERERERKEDSLFHYSIDIPLGTCMVYDRQAGREEEKMVYSKQGEKHSGVTDDMQ